MAEKKRFLENSVESLLVLVEKRGVHVTSQELINIIRNHSIGAMASMMASGMLPGVGGVAATAVEIGFVWTMYYRICEKLNINLKKETLKAIGSALITNIAASVVSQIIASTVLSVIPGLGTLGSMALCGFMGYYLTYYSGVVFMQLLIRIFKAGRTPEEVSEGELKKMMKDIVSRITPKDVRKEAQQAYKEDREHTDRAATSLDTEAPAPTKPAHAYWLHTGIDFGSTNSIMAWKLYHWTQKEGWTVDQQYNRANNVIRCATMLVYPKDNPDHPALMMETEPVIVGHRAEELASDSQQPASARTNFKPMFYDAPFESAEQKEAQQLIQDFLHHMYALYNSEILGCLPSPVLNDMNATVHLSTPVRADQKHKKQMLGLAQKAGFKNDGKQNFIDVSRDEAECIMHLAVAEKEAALDKLEEMGYAKSALNLMFIDVGGSTTDIELIKREMHRQDNTTKVLSMWPRRQEHYMLGGCEVDRALFDYLLEHECLIARYANEAWENGTAKTLFRLLKENNNEALRAGHPIKTLGTIRSACGDPDEEEFPRNKYKDYLITQKIYENTICKRYIDDLCAAIHDVVRAGGIGEEDIDAVFVCGAGSRLYFIHDLLLGRHGENPIAMTQIQQDEERLFDRFEDPAICCAIGAISNVM